jgi:PqqD family protein of HPr-rel-A system
VAARSFLYRAEGADQRLVEPIDAITLIYQRRSGITHMVTEPVPEMLAAMGDAPVDAATLVARLSELFDLGDVKDAEDVITARLEELAELALVERVLRDA